MKIVLLCAFLAAPSAWGRWLDKSESGSVIEKFHITYDVRKDGGWTQEIESVTRVQTEDAKTSASLFAIDYNSVTDKVEVISAYTLNGKEKIPVDKSAIEDRDKGESKDYDALKVRSVVFPQVRIGSKLFIRYRVTTDKPLLKNQWSDELSVAPSVFVEDFRLRITSERPLVYDLHDPMKLLKVTQKDARHLEAVNRKDFPGWVQAEKDAWFHPDGFTELWISTSRDWADFLSELNGGFEKVQTEGLPAGLKSWVAEAAKKATPAERILVVMEKMSHDFRYFGDWRRLNGGILPRSLGEIERSRYGDCKDLASLLASMLRALHLHANVALIRRGDNPWLEEPDYKIPAIGHFNHAIVQVKLPDDRTLWLDATNPVASLVPYPDIAGRPAWVLDPKQPHFERLPAARFEDFQHVHDYEYRFQAKDVVAVRVNADLKNLAPYQLENQLLMRPKSEVLSSALEYFSEGQEVKSFHYEKEPRAGRSLKDLHMVLDYNAGRVTFSAGKEEFFVIPDGLLEGAFYETADRESDLRLSTEPFHFSGTRRLVDTRLAQDLPAPCRVDSPWMTLERRVRVEGHDVVIVQNMDLKRPYITRGEFRSPSFLRLQADAKRCFYRSGVLIEPWKGALSMRSQ